MTQFRAIGAFWPLLFIAPLWVVLDRLCWSAPGHFVLHLTMVLHERLPAVIALAAAISLGAVARKLLRANASLQTLRALASTMPPRLSAAVSEQAGLLGMAVPPVIHLDVATPVCCAVVPGRSILVSRGFLDDLDTDGLAQVVRHELVHVRRGDPLRGLLWHLLFTALLIPGFGDLERWLYDRRERQTDELAGTLERTRFAELESRVRDAEREFQRTVGHGYAGALARLPDGRKCAVFLRPAIAMTVFGALLVSHALFMNALPFLERHHC